jgi:hypothetical protein
MNEMNKPDVWVYLDGEGVGFRAHSIATLETELRDKTAWIKAQEGEQSMGPIA